jgi:hypothetical protein
MHSCNDRHKLFMDHLRVRLISNACMISVPEMNALWSSIYQNVRLRLTSVIRSFTQSDLLSSIDVNSPSQTIKELRKRECKTIADSVSVVRPTG